MDFKTNEGIKELFKSVNGVGCENCFFTTFTNIGDSGFKSNIKDGAKYAATGVLLGPVAAFSKGYIDGANSYSGYLINETEKGLAFIPLKSKGTILKIDVMHPLLDQYFFIATEKIEKIIVKNFNIFNKSTQKIKIFLKDGKSIYLLSHVKEKNIPYQEENFAKFMNKYSKK